MTLYRKPIIFLIIFLGIFSYVEKSLAGDATSPYVSTLKNNLVEALIKDGICQDRILCRKNLQMRTEGYKRIYLNIYNQADVEIISYTTAFFIKEGLKITKGAPITLSIYPKSADDYMGFKYSFNNNDYLINLELNK